MVRVGEEEVGGGVERDGGGEMEVKREGRW